MRTSLWMFWNAVSLKRKDDGFGIRVSGLTKSESRSLMSLFARLMYRALVWKERQRAQRARREPERARRNSRPAHLETGERGETLAYWYLRQAGYTIVARNRRRHSQPGELDLVGWDGPVLAFVEVKTRTSAEAGPPEAAVTRPQQKRMAKAAADYLRRLKRKSVNYRFDIVSICWDSNKGYKARLIKDAFKDRIQDF